MNIPLKRATFAAGLLAALMSSPSALAAIYTISASNFTMLRPDAVQFGGATDVFGTFDDTRICYNVSCTNVNGMTLASNQAFFSFPWTALNIRVFGPGSYTVDTACSGAQIAAGVANCGGGASRQMSFTVNTGQLGAHMLFNWNTSSDIDVVVVWNLNGAFGDQLYRTGTTWTPSTLWNLVSVDVNGDGNPGLPMLTGDSPFPGYYANFNINLTPTFSLQVAPVAGNVNRSTDPTTPINWTPVVSDANAADTLTCEIVTPPAGGTGTAAIESNCSTGSYDPQGFAGPTATFTYRAFDSKEYSNTATVTVNVSTTPPPIANDDSAETIGTTPVTLDLTTNDDDGDNNLDPTSVLIVTQPSNGAAVNNGDGTVTYTADAGYSGTDTFAYTVDDTDTQTSNTAVASITVQANAPSSSTGTFAPGALAISVGSTAGGGLTVADVGADTDLSQQCVGGCFDFTVSGLLGPTATVVLPLSEPIPANAVYRKLVGGTWRNFVTTDDDRVFSAAAISTTPLVCPQAGSSSYTNGLAAGNRCLQLTITDGGSNDTDGLTNGTVVDPGGVGVSLASVVDQTPATTSLGSASGCSLALGQYPGQRLDFWLVALLVALLGVRRTTRTN